MSAIGGLINGEGSIPLSRARFGSGLMPRALWAW